MSTTSDTTRKQVRERYAEIARGASAGSGPEPAKTAAASSCCAPATVEAERAAAATGCGCSPSLDVGYAESDLAKLPDGADLGLGCGNPTALAQLNAGETVLDLGSGAGIDCFLAGERVGPKGRVIGVDMTPEMIERARENAGKVGAKNVEFRLGEIEHLPVPDASVDVVISNCVVNLSPDKSRVYAEMSRALRPGGRVSLSDIVAVGEIPEAIRNDPAHYAGCVSGAVPPAEIESMLRGAGFTDVSVDVVNVKAPEGFDFVRSASVHAVKPA